MFNKRLVVEDIRVTAHVETHVSNLGKKDFKCCFSEKQFAVFYFKLLSFKHESESFWISKCGLATETVTVYKRKLISSGQH